MQVWFTSEIENKSRAFWCDNARGKCRIREKRIKYEA